MITIINANILTASKSIICQQVNCCNVMGAGLAKAIYTKWPKVKSEYHRAFDDIPTSEYDALLGHAQAIIVGPAKCVINIFGQKSFGRNKHVVYTDYNALARGLSSAFALYYNSSKYTNIAIPYGIGCGLANGDWNVVYDMIIQIHDQYRKLYKDKQCNVLIYKLE